MPHYGRAGRPGGETMGVATMADGGAAGPSGAGPDMLYIGARH